MSSKTWKRFSLLLACLLAAGPAAWAVDGVLEINQACVANGCFPGDGAGFPVEITQPGSYRLTSNLQVPDEDTDGIYVEGNSGQTVTIDLNGFTISGPDTGTLAAGEAIFSNQYAYIKNGAVTGMSSSGIWLQRGGRIENVRASRNSGAAGFVVNGGGVVVDSTAESNSGDGFLLQGFPDSARFVIKGCVANHNDASGISATFHALILGNHVFDNDGAGIAATSSMVRENLVLGNGGYGLVLSSTTGYAENTVNNNNGGNSNPQVNGGIEIGTNLCGGDTTCP